VFLVEMAIFSLHCVKSSQIDGSAFANTHEMIVGTHRRSFPKKVGKYWYRKLKSPKMLKMPPQ
jgi:hypothetical protein